MEEALILLYLLVDDGYRAVTFGGRLRQRGPELSDVEVLTMEIFGEQQGCRERRLDPPVLRRALAALLPEAWVLPGLRPTVRRLVRDQAADPGPRVSGQRNIHLLDGFPIPLCWNCRGTRCRTFQDVAAWGYCATKQEYFYGLCGHLVITLAGTVVAFTVAKIDERDVVPNLYGTIRGLLIGDKGFISGNSSQPRRSMRSQVS